MGWVSTLEDIIDRLNSDLHSVKNNLNVNKSFSTDKPKLEALIRVCECLVMDINEHLKIVKNPKLDLAVKLIESEETNKNLKDKFNKSEKINKKLTDKIEVTEQELNDLKEKYTNLQNNFIKVRSIVTQNAQKVQELETEQKRLETENQGLKNFFSQIRSGTPLTKLRPLERNLDPNKNQQPVIHKPNNFKKRNGRY